MNVYLNDIGKKYLKEWIIPGLSHHFSHGSSTAITGNNGSGKSTLLKLIAGITPLSKGKIEFFDHGNEISQENTYREITYCAPYQELIEELTLKELLEFHLSFRVMKGDKSANDIAEQLQLTHALNKPIFYYSSGMKQRVKLGLALLTHASVTLLDEPTTNLDKFGIDWYLNLVASVKSSRTIIVASNQPVEYEFCQNNIHLSTK